MSAPNDFQELLVEDIDRAARYYACVFGARIDRDGAFLIGGARYGLRPGPAEEAAPVPVTCADPDVVVARAAARGGRILQRCADGPEGRSGLVEDPFGHRWRVRRA